MEHCLERLKAYFDEHAVRYEVQHHRVAYTAQRVADELGEKGRHVAKVVVAWIDGKMAMLVLPAPAHVDDERLAAWLGAKEVTHAHEDEFQHLFPDCEVGAMPPFGNLYHLPVYLDRSLADEPYLVFQAGSHRETMRIAATDYVRLVSPTVGEFVQPPRSVMAVG